MFLYFLLCFSLLFFNLLYFFFQCATHNGKPQNIQLEGVCSGADCQTRTDTLCNECKERFFCSAKCLARDPEHYRICFKKEPPIIEENEDTCADECPPNLEWEKLEEMSLEMDENSIRVQDTLDGVLVDSVYSLGEGLLLNGEVNQDTLRDGSSPDARATSGNSSPSLFMPLTPFSITPHLPRLSGRGLSSSSDFPNNMEPPNDVPEAIMKDILASSKGNVSQRMPDDVAQLLDSVGVAVHTLKKGTAGDAALTTAEISESPSFIDHNDCMDVDYGDSDHTVHHICPEFLLNRNQCKRGDACTLCHVPLRLNLYNFMCKDYVNFGTCALDKLCPMWHACYNYLSYGCCEGEPFCLLLHTTVEHCLEMHAPAVQQFISSDFCMPFLWDMCQGPHVCQRRHACKERAVGLQCKSLSCFMCNRNNVQEKGLPSRAVTLASDSTIDVSSADFNRSPAPLPLSSNISATVNSFPSESESHEKRNLDTCLQQKANDAPAGEGDRFRESLSQRGENSTQDTKKSGLSAEERYISRIDAFHAHNSLPAASLACVSLSTEGVRRAETAPALQPVDVKATQSRVDDTERRLSYEPRRRDDRDGRSERSRPRRFRSNSPVRRLSDDKHFSTRGSQNTDERRRYRDRGRDEDEHRSGDRERWRSREMAGDRSREKRREMDSKDRIKERDERERMRERSRDERRPR